MSRPGLAGDGLVGLRPLLEVSARTDRRNIAPWVAVVTALPVSSVLAFTLLFADRATVTTLGATIGGNPAFSLIFGTARNLSTVEGFTAWRSLALGGFFTALMAIFTVTRNSRANEDSGQAELIASTVVGRHARLGTAVVMAWAASLAVGLVSAAVTIIFGGGIAATVTLSATFTATGLVFAGVAAVTAQVGSFARTANSIAVTVLGVCYLVRGYADASPDTGWVRWLTPLGWTESAAPGTDNNWWPLLACLSLAVALIGVANLLSARRDFGMGLIPPAPGPARGTTITHPWGLALRLHRGSVLSWSVAFVLIGSVFGLLSSSIGKLVGANPQFAQILAATGGNQDNLVFEFLLTLLKILAILAAVCGIQIVLRVYAEEAQYRVEPLLATALSRSRFYASHAAIALLAPTIALLLASLALGLTANAAGAEIGLGDLALQAIAELPAIWILIGVSLAAVGTAPQLRLVSWLGVVATFALTILGPSLNLWDGLLAISPLWHVPNITAADPAYLPLLWLTLIATGLIILGFLGYRQRDLQYEQP